VCESSEDKDKIIRELLIENKKYLAEIESLKRKLSFSRMNERRMGDKGKF
jgi:hypothetical protein